MVAAWVRSTGEGGRVGSSSKRTRLACSESIGRQISRLNIEAITWSRGDSTWVFMGAILAEMIRGTRARAGFLDREDHSVGRPARTLISPMMVWAESGGNVIRLAARTARDRIERNWKAGDADLFNLIPRVIGVKPLTARPD